MKLFKTPVAAEIHRLETKPENISASGRQFRSRTKRGLLGLMVVAGYAAHAVSGATGEGAQRMVHKVLFVGDSITLHPPNKALDWTGNWGMAASAPEKDYAHLFYGAICAAQPNLHPELVISGRDVAVAGRIDQNLANLDRLKAVGADLIVVQLGENEGAKDLGTFEELYERLVVGLKGDQAPTILCTGVWRSGENSAKNHMIRAICLRQGAHFVAIEPMPPGCDAGSEAGKFTNQGVNWHPGDKGMQHYADALWTAVKAFLGIRSLSITK